MGNLCEGDVTTEKDLFIDTNISTEKVLGNGRTILEIVKGDITEEWVDVIVNPTDKHLYQGIGLSAYIVKKGGEIIIEESMEFIHKNGEQRDGTVIPTSAGIMPAKRLYNLVMPSKARWTRSRSNSLTNY